MSEAELAIVSLVANLLILCVTAWLKLDVANLKLYMHEKFVTREDFRRHVNKEE